MPHDQIDHIVARLTEKGAETAAFFRSLNPGQWQTQTYSDGPAWNVSQVLAHFVSAEKALLELFQDVANGGMGAPEDFHINPFNEREVRGLSDVPPADLIARFEAARAALVDFVGMLDDSYLDRRGRHPWFGVDRMEKFVKLVYRHNMIHERDIRRALGVADS